MTDAAGIGGVQPITKLVEALTPTWDAAQEKTSAWTRDPFTELHNMGDFLQVAAEAQWDAFRQTWEKAQVGANAVVGILETPCDDKWSVAVRLALPAAREAFMLLLQVSPDEVIEEYLQPKRDRTKDRRRKKPGAVRRGITKAGRVRRLFPDVPDVDNQTSRLLPGGEWVRGRKVGIGETLIFEAIDRSDRLLWYWLVVEVGADFFWLWSSNMMESRFCSAPASDAFNFTTTQDRSGTGSSGFWGEPSEIDTIHTDGWGPFVDGDMILGKYADTKGRLVISSEAFVTNNWDEPREFEYQIAASGRKGGTIIQTYFSGSERVTLQPGQSRTFIQGINAEISGIDRWKLTASMDGLGQDTTAFLTHQAGWWGTKDV